MRLLSLPTAIVLPALLSCMHVDSKAREHLRLGPLREVRALPVDVDRNIAIDAGTDALSDDELTRVKEDLAGALADSFAGLAERSPNDGKAMRAGTARVGRCQLRAGPSARFVVYLATCRVALVVDGIVVIEATGEGLRRTQSVFLRKKARRLEGRDPLVEFTHSRAVLMAALEAAAHVIADGPPPRAGEPPLLPRPQRAAFARARLASASTSADTVAALFDLRSTGVPPDASLAARFLDARVLAPAVPAPAAREEPSEPDGPSRLLIAGAERAAPDVAVPVLSTPLAIDEGKPAVLAPAMSAPLPRADVEPARDLAIVAAAIDAIGELCDPSLAARVQVIVSAPADVVDRAKGRALPRLRACVSLARSRALP